MDERTVEVLDKSKRKEYQKMMRSYRKLLRKDVKDSAPWEWSFGLSLFIDFLKWMHAYYKLGYNVWALDVTDPKEPIHTEKTREDSLKETIMWYDRWMNVDEDFIKIVYTKEDLQHYLDLGFHLRKESCDSGEDAVQQVNHYYLTLYEDNNKNTEELIKATKECKHKFFECLEKYIEEWWD